MEISSGLEQALPDLFAFNFSVEHQTVHIHFNSYLLRVHLLYCPNPVHFPFLLLGQDYVVSPLTAASSTSMPQNPALWSPTESATAPAQPTSPNLHQCSHCHKLFKSKGNVNRHMKYDCAFGTRRKFSWRYPGCGKPFSRKAYRQQHETSSCRQRPGAGYATTRAPNTILSKLMIFVESEARRTRLLEVPRSPMHLARLERVLPTHISSHDVHGGNRAVGSGVSFHLAYIVDVHGGTFRTHLLS